MVITCQPVDAEFFHQKDQENLLLRIFPTRSSSQPEIPRWNFDREQETTDYAD